MSIFDIISLVIWGIVAVFLLGVVAIGIWAEFIFPIQEKLTAKRKARKL